MPNADYAWQRYEDLQKRAMNSLHTNNYSWGIEAALSMLLKAIEAGTVESDPSALDEVINRKISSEARLQRSRAIKLKTLAIQNELLCVNGSAEANIELDRISRVVTNGDKAILMDAAYGYSDRELAGRHKATPGAIRTRLSRLRLRLSSMRGNSSRTRRATSLAAAA